MWTILKHALKHSHKILHVSELVLSSYFLTHNLKSYIGKSRLKVLKRLSSSELMLLMRNKVVSIVDKESRFCGNGVLCEDYVFVSLSGVESEVINSLKGTGLQCKHAATPNDQLESLEAVEILEGEAIAIYKLTNPPTKFPLEPRYRELAEGEKLLVYSPLDADKFVLQDTYVLKKNILDLADKLPVHRTSLRNDDSSASDLTFDYYGNFQGYIPPASDMLVDSKVVQHLTDRLKAGKPLERLSLGASVSVHTGDSGQSQIEVSDIQADSLVDRAGINAGDIIEEIDGQKVHTIEQYNKILGYAFNTEVTVKVVRGGQPTVIKIKV